MILRQSTAVDVLIGPFLDLTDGATSEAGETPTVKLSKNGQALAAKSDVTVPVYDADGYYNCELDVTDTNTIGQLVLTVAKSATALPVRHEFDIVDEAVYDALFGTTALATATNITAGTITTATNVTTVNGLAANVITAASINADAITAAKIADNAIDSATLAADVTGRIATAVWEAATVTYGGAGTYGLAVEDILTDTAEIGAAGAGLTNINLPNQTMDITGNITGNLSGSVGSVTGAVGSVTGNVGGNVTGSVGSVVGAVGSVTGLTASDVGAIKAKTDSLAFTVAGQVDANIQYVNDVAVTGDGQPGTEWGP